ncbi:truncated vp39 [Drosophila innubila nudivirus]|uniref:Truncated vp39 n=1 Tax=Drosophila innubila nudivirus TaxID=2057187 RepID=A0A2H4UX90_9VIRU|nr:truncated vp39 [Drosophila innubila nudivirus]ATZ81532.1 truncated vp39 [Drosophila innubila nudivirus]
MMSTYLYLICNKHSAVMRESLKLANREIRSRRAWSLIIEQAFSNNRFNGARLKSFFHFIKSCDTNSQ